LGIVSSKTTHKGLKIPAGAFFLLLKKEGRAIEKRKNKMGQKPQQSLYL